METRRVPPLKIELCNEGKSIMLRPAVGDGRPFDCNLSEIAASQYRELLEEGLVEMKEAVDGHKLTVAEAQEVLKRFFQRGVTVLSDIFGGVAELRAVGQLFREFFPNWQSKSEPANITVVAELSRFVPLELLPIFDTAPWPRIGASKEILSANARRFPGFSAMIKREFKAPVNHDLVLKNEPKLALRCFLNESLREPAAAEFGYFVKHKKYIDIEGPWPPSGLDGDIFADSLLNSLRFADKTFAGGVRSSIDQIQHFICHCTIAESAYKSELEFSHKHRIKIWELISRIAQEGTTESPRERSGSAPLIFLNACSGSRIDPMAVTSFPKFFLQNNGNRGFIGTETDVPNDFAAEFSQCFYHNLLGGMRLGKAIHEAKWRVLIEKNNPLGIIYTVYADPNLQVSNRVKWPARSALEGGENGEKGGS